MEQSAQKRDGRLAWRKGMIWPALSSLRGRLGLLFLIALVPTVLLQTGLFALSRRQAAIDAYGQALALARVAAAEQDRDIEQTRQLLSVFVQHEAVRALEAERCSAFAASLLSPIFTNIGAATPDGKVFCSAIRAKEPVLIHDRSYFQHALTHGAFAIGEYQIGRITGKPGINLGYPIRAGGGRIVGVAFAALDLVRLNDIVSQANLPVGATLAVVDEKGTILARYPDPGPWVGQQLPEAELLRVMRQAGTEGTARARGLDGVSRLYGFTVLPSAGAGNWVFVSVGIPAVEAFSAVDTGFVFNLVGLMAVGLATLAALILSANALIVKPFHSLTRTAERLAAGDLSARTGLRRPMDELQQLTHTFDGMAEALEQRETERQRAEDRVTQQLQTLTTLYAGAQRLTRSLDVESLSQDIVRTLVDVFETHGAWLGRLEPDGTMRTLAKSPRDALEPSTQTKEMGKSEGPLDRAVRTGFPVIVDNLSADPATAARGAALRARGIQSLAALPLITRDRTFGAIVVSSDRSDSFGPDRVELLQAFANQAAAALENARLFEETERRIARLGALRAIDQAITGSLDLRLSLAVLLEQVTTQLRVDAADILSFNPNTRMLEYAAGRGFRSADSASMRIRLGEGYAGTAALERRVIEVPDLRSADGLMRRHLVSVEGFQSYYAVPLVAKGEIKGVLEVCHRTAVASDPDWVEFLEALAGQAAIAIDNAGLFEELQRSNLDLTLAYDTTLEGWSRALDLRDKETEGHTQRVADLTLRLARAMGMREEELVHVRRGALLHDIGKMGIPDSILLKPGPLTDDEWVIMRKHPVYAFELLSPITHLRPALDIPYTHHEKWDGTGYPRGLKGEQIPPAARIFAVVDVWDALTSDRPYRPAWTREKALAHIQAETGRHFDPAVVKAFLAIIGEQGPAQIS